MSKEPLFVTCPVCGKVNQKSLFTYSEVRCQRCHRELTAFADLGVVVGIDMNLAVEMWARSECHTIPQIFIDDAHVGSLAELLDMVESGELDQLKADFEAE